MTVALASLPLNHNGGAPVVHHRESEGTMRLGERPAVGLVDVDEDAGKIGKAHV